MAVRHLAYSGGHFSPLDEVVHFLAWVSGAAGFVFLSGVSVGLVWTKWGGCTSVVRRWTAGRAVFLALVSLAVNAAGIAWFAIVGRPDWYPPVDPTVMGVLTSQWALPFSKILPMYAVLLLVAAVAGPLMMRAPRLALAGSFGVYLASLVLPGVGPSEHPGAEPLWNLPAWQVLFMVGLVAGVNWAKVRATIDRYRWLVIGGGAIGLLVIGVLRVGFNLAEHGIDPVGLGAARVELGSFWLSKPNVGPLRLVLIALIGPAAYVLSRYRLPVDRLVTAAGSRSLRVYVVSTLVAFVWVWLDVDASPPLVDLLILIATGLVLATGLARPIGRGRAWSL